MRLTTPPKITEEERKYWVAFNAFNGVGPRRFRAILAHFGSAKKAWQGSGVKWEELGLGPVLMKKFFDFRDDFSPSSYFLRLEEEGILVLTSEDEEYPELLKKIDDAPFVLYLKGEVLPTDLQALAVVGTRKITSYGRQVTQKLTGELVGVGLTIVSGLAYGVDSLAHETTLDAGGRTIGVVASGLDIISPPGRRQLAQRIVDSGQGAVISEFPLGMTPTRGSFPARNRIIAGLSLGVLVTEGAQDSGALITAGHAAAQGREVFAVPGPITGHFSAAPNYLLKQGAKMVTSVEDILEELKIEEVSPLDTARGSSRGFTPRGKQVSKATLSKEEEKLLSFLELEQRHIDELVRLSQMKPEQVATTLSLMELKGRVQHLGGMVYAILK